MHLDDTFFDEVGLSGASAERKAELSQQMAELAENRLITELSEHLSDEQLDRFDELTETEGADTALVYLQAQIPNFKEIVEQVNQQVVSDFTTDFKALVDQASPKA